ncbi:hypothetical protein SAMN04487910_3899 [Aquimarina amphilecti]|uniref:Uncharacterized protein n=1 Tax=Aquimarina amphilecti TaxID=1038014 RepID=A0A1H7UVG5_AQUAM|nr:hypothetical protein [Aquimarina amphilecti]SEM00963.1 hypothetical protein SAMN04487910_3899 [Aquimarina amphilecti]
MDKKDKILDRVIVFAAHLGISLRSFSLSIGASAGYLHRLQSANSNIGGDFIEKIIQLYTEINPVWLVTGEGDMLKDELLVQESGVTYGKKDHFKQVLLQYLDDQDIKDKLLEIVNK